MGRLPPRNDHLGRLRQGESLHRRPPLRFPPDLVVGRLGRRDEFVDSDWFYFGVDPYYDRRSGYFFAVNPSGSIADGTLSNDETKDPTWDGIWESAARLDDTGWCVEIRIPFQQLRFKSRDAYTWGVNFQRDIKRKKRDRLLCLEAKGGERIRFAVRRPRRDPGHRDGPPSRGCGRTPPHAPPSAPPCPAILSGPAARLRPVPASTQGPPPEQPDPRRLRQSRLRPGRSRSGRHQHHRPGDLLPGKAAFLHRRRVDLQFRQGRP